MLRMFLLAFEPQKQASATRMLALKRWLV